MTPHRDGVIAVQLDSNSWETVSYRLRELHATLESSDTGGMKMFVVNGDVVAGGNSLSKWDWLRMPLDHSEAARVGDSGASVWNMTSHLAHGPAHRKGRTD